jgi:hypothetical protein
MTCIICGKPRDGTRLWCGGESCYQAVKAMPFEKLNAIRQREAIEAWKQNPPSANIYIHMTPREAICTRCHQLILASDKTESYTYPPDGRIVHSRCVGELIQECLAAMAAVPDSIRLLDVEDD